MNWPPDLSKIYEGLSEEQAIKMDWNLFGTTFRKHGRRVPPWEIRASNGQEQDASAGKASEDK